MKDEINIGDSMAAAFQAILRGDYAARDIICAQMERTFEAKESQELPSETPIVCGKEGTN